MDLGAWVEAHAGADVIVQVALALDRKTATGNRLADAQHDEQLSEETGRLIGIVDGMLYLDRPTYPSSVSVPEVIALIEQSIKERGTPPYGVFASGASPTPIAPSRVTEIELDRKGVGRQRFEQRRAESARERAFIRHLVATEPCCVCGRVVQPGDGGYDILGPGSRRGDEGDPDSIPVAATWRVVCLRHQ